MTDGKSATRRRPRRLPLKVGPAALRRLLRERRSRVRRGRLERLAALTLAAALLAYGALPGDAVPDRRLPAGWLDDLAVLGLGFWLVVLLLRLGQRQRRLARRLAEDAPAAGALPEHEGRRRQERWRGAVVIVAGVVLGLAASLAAQWLLPGPPSG